MKNMYKRLIAGVVATMVGAVMIIQPLAAVGYDETTNAYDFVGSSGSVSSAGISEISLSKDIYDPNTQGANMINFTLSGTVSNLNVYLKSSTGTMIKTISSQNQITTGSQSVSWDGSGSTASKVAVGVYYIEVHATSTSGGTSVQSHGVFVVPSSATAPAITNVNVTPAVMTPSQPATFTFTSAAPALAEINVFTIGGAGVDLPIRSSDFSAVAGSNTWVWDGKKDDGSVVPTGEYTVTIALHNTTSSRLTAMKAVMTSSTGTNPTGVLITSFNVSPATFSQGTTITISATIASTSLVSFKVMNSSGATVKNVDSVMWLSGSNSFTWNGNDNNGVELPAGTYTYEFSVQNLNTGLIEKRIGTLTITGTTGGGTGPVSNGTIILNDNVAPLNYNPLKTVLHVNYYILGTANVTVFIMKDQSIVKTLKNFAAESGTNMAIWDGRDINGKYVAGGTYRYRVIASTGVGGVTDVKEDTFTVTGGTVGDPTVYCAGFKDVKTDSQYCNAIVEMKNLGIFEGYSDNTFRPNTPINRAETVKVVMHALKYNVPKTGWYFNSAGFKDVYSGEWYTPYLAAARLYDIIEGYKNKTFKPAQTVNRAEMLKIFLEASNITKQSVPCVDKPYSDVAKTIWYKKYACYAKYYSLVDATGSKLVPAAAMTRGDVAVMIYRAQLQGLMKTLPPKPQIDFTKIKQYEFPYMGF